MLYTMENTKNQGIVSMKFSLPDLRKKIFFISVLALSDTLFLVIQLITLGLLESVNEYEFSKSILFGTPVIVPLRNFAYICSIYFIVLLTIERFIVICHQHKVQDISTLDFLTPSFNSGFSSTSFNSRLFNHEVSNSLELKRQGYGNMGC